MKKVAIFFLVIGLIILAATTVVKAQDEITCPANSYLSGDQCLCNSGYVSSGGNCITESQACAPYGPSHLVGTDCVCNEGYGVLSGSSKCVSLSAACAQYNAIWSAAKGDCVCVSGTHENTATGKCVADVPVPAPVKVEPTPVITEPISAPVPISAPIAEPINAQPQPVNVPEQPADTFTPVDNLMSSQYATLPPAVQTVITENNKVLNEMSTQTYSSQEDAIAILTKEATQPLVNQAITQSITVAPAEDMNEIKNQQAVLQNFSDQGPTEIQIKGEEIIPKLHEAFVRQNFPQELQAWQKQYEEAKQKAELKPGANAKDLENGIEMENRLKWQIAELQKIVGFNHLRCLEANKALQFDTMSKEYKQYFNGKSADDMFEAAAEGIAFTAAAKNASAGSTQLRELKDQLKRQYPEDWQVKYYNVADKPDLNKKLQQTDNIFKVFEKLKK